jgi:radical SAM PhpK family P-methyltransferase
MALSDRLDCVVIGHNEPPFQEYERLVRGYGEAAEAARDLQFSYVDLDGLKLDYSGLMNYGLHLANGGTMQGEAPPVFKSGDIPALAAAYLTDYLRKRNYNATYISLYQFEKEALACLLRERRPRCVAITTTLYVLNFPAVEIVRFIRSVAPETTIIIGGPLVANHARNFGVTEASKDAAGGTPAAIAGIGPQPASDEFAATIAELGADIYVIESQGETTLCRIIDCLRAQPAARVPDLSGVPNLAYMDGDRLVVTPKEAETNGVDENYIDWAASDRPTGPVIQTRTARSCAFSCAFCNYPSRAGKLSLASVDTVEKELESIREVGGVSSVVFIDDTFNVPLPRFKDLCRLMIRKQYGFRWYSYFRCSNSDEEAIDLMAESGCAGVFLGIESGSPQILKNMNKAATIEKYEVGIALLRKHQILTFASFIVGFPGETAATVAETTAFIKRTRPDYYRAQLWYCEAGTPIERQRDLYGITGNGFVWEHATMESMGAMDHIEAMFLSISESLWLPQWSFDFWILPSLLAKGLTREQVREFMAIAAKALALEIATVSAVTKRRLQQDYVRDLRQAARAWRISA